jgi:hypothetical protein
MISPRITARTFMGRLFNLYPGILENTFQILRLQSIFLKSNSNIHIFFKKAKNNI